MQFNTVPSELLFCVFFFFSFTDFCYVLLHNFEGVFVCQFFPLNNKNGLGKQNDSWFLKLLSSLCVSSAIKRRLFSEPYLVFVLR